MSDEDLRSRLLDIDSRFKAEKIKHDQLEAQLEGSDTEIKRLQGEYRALESLLREMVAKAEEGKKRG